MEATAKVIRWSGKTVQTKERAPMGAAVVGVSGLSPASTAADFAGLEHMVVMIPDEQLDALGRIFCASPLRKAMTFEGYLVAKGFGVSIH